MNKYKENIEDVKKFIHENYHQRIDLNSLANVACFSSFHFSRIFHSITGYTPMQDLKKIRLEKSTYYLTHSSLNVSEVAYKCGFNSISSFNASFKTQYKKSPNEFKKLQRSKIKEEIGNNQKELFTDKKHNLNNSLLRRIWSMNVNIKELPEYRIAFFRHVGSYLNTGENWNKLLKWAGEKDLFKTNPLFIGISRDDPATTEEDACRHDACVTLPKDFNEESDGSEVLYDLIRIGKYAIYEFYDSIDKLGLVYKSLFSQWLPQSDYEMDSRLMFRD